MAQAAPPQAPERTAADLYQRGCSICHGPDGKGSPRSLTGFDAPLPDFSDCRFAAREPDRDWTAVVTGGGRVRSLDRMMPAFGDVLSDEDIRRVVAHVRGFCANAAWPRGELNFPRAFVTEKAFPEDEVVLEMSASRQADRYESRLVYERRVGPRTELEAAVPFVVQGGRSGWNHGLGDISVGMKHVALHSYAHGSIVSGGATLTIPTGDVRAFLGTRLTVLDVSAAIGQRLPFGGFVQGQLGVGFPLNIETANRDGFWRAAAGRTFVQERVGRAWSPMVEVLGERELAFGERVRWDILPEVEVTLSRRQHVTAGGGVRLPVRGGRPRAVVASLVWDWFEGAAWSGWR